MSTRTQRRLVLAPDLRRLTAAALDGGLVWGVTILLWRGGLGWISAWIPEASPDFWAEHLLTTWRDSPLTALSPLLAPLLLGALWQAVWLAQTPGKRLMSLVVTDAEGDPPATWQALTRASGCALSWALLGFGILLIWMSHERRSLHEWLSDTRTLWIGPKASRIKALHDKP